MHLISHSTQAGENKCNWWIAIKLLWTSIAPPNPGIALFYCPSAIRHHRVSLFRKFSLLILLLFTRWNFCALTAFLIIHFITIKVIIKETVFNIVDSEYILYGKPPKPKLDLPFKNQYIWHSNKWKCFFNIKFHTNRLRLPSKLWKNYSACLFFLFKKSC